MKKNFKILLIISSILCITLANAFNTYASPLVDTIDLSKIATKKDITYGRDTNVKLTISGQEIEKEISKDIVIVIDESESMNEDFDDSTKADITKAKTIDLITSLLNQSNKTKIGIVAFGDDLLKEYSTNSLSSNKDDLVLSLNSIPVIEDNATNIQSGLNKAFELLEKSKANQKHIILLTDGEPTAFTYKKRIYGTRYNDDAVCYIGIINCIKARPSERAKLEVEKIKQKDIKLWTVGLTAKQNAKDFLTDIGDHYYDVGNTDDLINSFNSIKEKIDTIMINSIVEDKISSYWLLDEESIKVNYGTALFEDNTITWTINNLIGSKDLTLEYKLTAKEPYYGSIWTNDNASLSGNLINKYYRYNDYTSTLYFNKPTTPIPPITINDEFEVRETEVLTNNILNNDKLEKINDDDSLISNKIVITKNVNCGLLKVNDNGNITYDSMDCTDNANFSYYISSKINDIETKSEVADVTIKINKFPTTYTIKYLDKNNKSLQTEKTKDGYLNEIIEEEYIDIEGYKLISPVKKNLKLAKNSNIIEFIYEKIDYLIDNNNIIKNGTKIINNKNNIIEYAINLEKTIDNYKGPIQITITDYLPYEIDLENSSIEDGIYDEDKKTITWLIEDNINTFKNNSYKIDFNRSLKIKYKEILDNTFKNIIKSTISLAETDDIINNNEWETIVKDKGNIIVNYIDKNKKNIIDPIIIDGLIGSAYKTEKKNFDNYELIDIWNSESGYISEDPIEVTYVYDKVLTPPKTGYFDTNNTIYLLLSLTSFIILIIKKIIKKRIN